MSRLTYPSCFLAAVTTFLAGAAAGQVSSSLDTSADDGGALADDIMIQNSTSAGATQPDVLISGGGMTNALPHPIGRVVAPPRASN